jgi:hypothetical protein
MLTRAPPDGAMVFREASFHLWPPLVTVPPVHFTLAATMTVPAHASRYGRSNAPGTA